LAAASDFMSRLWAALCYEICIIDLRSAAVVGTVNFFFSRSWMQISLWN